MSNILKTIDLTDHAIRRAVFAVFDAAEHRANRKGSERWRRALVVGLLGAEARGSLGWTSPLPDGQGVGGNDQ
jgi:hypothetical protein